MPRATSRSATSPRRRRSRSSRPPRAGSPRLGRRSPPTCPSCSGSARGVRLRGRVRDFDGAPIAGAAGRVNEISGLVQTQKVGDADAEGRYEVRGLGPNRGSSSRSAPRVSRRSGSRTFRRRTRRGSARKDFYIGHGAEITVAAVDAETGAPIPNARILGWAFTLAHRDGAAGRRRSRTRSTSACSPTSAREPTAGRGSRTCRPGASIPNSTNQCHSPTWSSEASRRSRTGYAIGSRRIEVPDDGASRSHHAPVPAGREPRRAVSSTTGRTRRGRADLVPGDTVRSRTTGCPARSAGTRFAQDRCERRLPIPRRPSSTPGRPGHRERLDRGEHRKALRSGSHGHHGPVSGTGTVRAPDLVLKRHRGTEFRFRVLDPQGRRSGARGSTRTPKGSTRSRSRTTRGARSARSPRRKNDVPSRDAIRVRPLARIRDGAGAVSRARGEIVVSLRRGERIAGRVVHEDGARPTRS